MLPHCSTSGVSAGRVYGAMSVEITPAAPRARTAQLPRLAERSAREHHRALDVLPFIRRRPSCPAPTSTSAQRHAAGRRAERIDRQRDAMRLAATAPPRRPGRRAAACRARAPSPGRRWRTSRTSAAGPRPRADRRCSCCDCSNAGFPASRHSGAMNVTTSIATLASTRRRELPIDRFRTRRQRAIERRQMRRDLRMSRDSARAHAIIDAELAADLVMSPA